MKKGLLYILIAVVLVITGGYFFLWGSSGKDLKFRTDKVTRGNVVLQVRATGTINPTQTINIGSQVSGIIDKFYADYNTPVKKGQVLAIIDSTFLFTAVQQAEANLERSKAELNQAKRAYERTKELFEKSLASQADMDLALATYESDEAAVKQTAAALLQAQVNLHYATITAPTDGVIIERDIDNGQTVAAGFQTPKLFLLATDLRKMQVEASVDEADIGQIKDGQSVTFTVDAYPDQQFAGTVTQVRLDPITTQNVVTYTVIIGVENPDLKLRPGMTATASIFVDRRENVLRVPTLAIRFTPPDAATNGSDQKTNGGSQQSGQQTGQPMGGQNRGQQGQQGQMRQGRGQGSDAAPGKQPGEQQSDVKMGRIWLVSATQQLKLVNVRLGLADNRYVEIISDDIKEGDDVAIGIVASESASSNGQTNPFQQRGMGPGPGGRGR
ncbi:MAG TPA: efflux RND transporter periplasmic adaptor subunit [Bacteroidota bacterium]|nr:efflux RND transporter periplasmic adaptor subunit [Bacteroidota bacterium]